MGYVTYVQKSSSSKTKKGPETTRKEMALQAVSYCIAVSLRVVSGLLPPIINNRYSPEKAEFHILSQDIT